MVELKVKRQAGGAVVIVDVDGDEHVAKTPQEAWTILRALTDTTTTRALVKQDDAPVDSRMKRRKIPGVRNGPRVKTQVVREPDREEEPEEDLVAEVLARTGAGLLNGVKSLGRTADFRRGSRRWPE